jgi:hypothetical protein
MATTTHVLHWIPPELERTRKWFGRKPRHGCWELQPLDAYEAARYDVQDVDFTILDEPVSRDVPAGVLEAAVGAVLGRRVSLRKDEFENAKGVYLIPGWRHGPVRWIDAPVYAVRLC